jgi:phospholipid-translocating ATPase
MANIVGPPDWLDEEVRELARTGLRTLVVAKKVITKEQYELFKVTD